MNIGNLIPLLRCLLNSPHCTSSLMHMLDMESSIMVHSALFKSYETLQNVSLIIFDVNVEA